jgi:hypothetical protein
MGLLDDAIREHLDLKRRRGADPAEVERAEREALGPVRRAPEEQPNGDLDSEAGIAYDHEADEEESWSHESLDDLPDVAGERDATAEPPEYGGPLADDEPELESEPDLAVADREDRTTPPPHPAGDHQTAEYDVEQALEAEHESGGDEDVLEETPEFLQDTPDHDRLWFEQRPPKDFDFDD